MVKGRLFPVGRCLVWRKGSLGWFVQNVIRGGLCPHFSTRINPLDVDYKRVCNICEHFRRVDRFGRVKLVGVDL
jgi:hypothetical protein